jgi:hypothetical protein
MQVILVDHTETPGQAFRRGLVKGFSAPLLVFAASQSAPVEIKPVLPPKIDPVRMPASLREKSDLQRLGMDFWAALNRYEEAAHQPAAVPTSAG